MRKVICPNCKSEDLEYFEEVINTKFYKLNKYNVPTNKVIRTIKKDDIGCFNYICQNCGEIFGGSASIGCEYKEYE